LGECVVDDRVTDTGFEYFDGVGHQFGHDEVLPPCGHPDESMWLGYAYAAVSEQPEDAVLALGQASHEETPPRPPAVRTT